MGEVLIAGATPKILENEGAPPSEELAQGPAAGMPLKDWVLGHYVPEKLTRQLARGAVELSGLLAGGPKGPEAALKLTGVRAAGGPTPNQVLQEPEQRHRLDQKEAPSSPPPPAGSL